MDQHNMLNRLEASMRAVGRQNRTVVAQNHFELFISPLDDEQMSFAVPLLPDPPAWSDPVRAMTAAFVQNDRRPRLEYIADLHPGLAIHLEEAGLTCDSRTPVMILETPISAPPGRLPDRVLYRRLNPGDETLLRAYLINQSIAFGGSGGEQALAWLDHLRDGMITGSVIAAALLSEEAPVAGAVVQIGADVGELAGVWTAARWRRHGLANALCQQLLAEFNAAGYSLCWLSAAEGAQRLYEKLGFVTLGTQVNFSHRKNGFYQ